MPAASKDTPSNDAMFTRSRLVYDESNRNLKSWLASSLGGAKSGSSPAAEPVANQAQNGEDVDDEEDLLGDTDEGGLGYTAPKPSSSDRHSLSSNDKLRKQLLVNHTKKNSSHLNSNRANILTASTPRPQSTHNKTKRSAGDDNDDDNEGRTSTAGRRSKSSTVAAAKAPVQNSSSAPTKNASKKRATTSYLDEALAKRQNKKAKTTSQGHSKVDTD